MQSAILLTAGLLDTIHAKTAHGLIRESKRFRIVAVVDPLSAGRDAGEVLDGKFRNIPVLGTIGEALNLKPLFCVVGVATSGGIFPDSMLEEVRVAISNGVSVVNGLHDYLNDRPDIKALSAENGVELIDVRKPKKRDELHFWTGGILHMKTPVVAVLGTDCSLGKRTTTRIVLAACEEAGLNAQMIYTGQTGWLQGGQYGFIFDSTLNDFVSGELEHAILLCNKETNPDIILLEGQSALRNPTGPCGSELIISGRAKHIVLVHAPKRKYYDQEEEWGEIPSIESEIALIKLYGANVIAIALNTENCSTEEMQLYKETYQATFGIPVILPLQDGGKPLISVLKNLTETACA